MLSECAPRECSTLKDQAQAEWLGFFKLSAPVAA